MTSIQMIPAVGVPVRKVSHILDRMHAEVSPKFLDVVSKGDGQIDLGEVKELLSGYLPAEKVDAFIEACLAMREAFPSAFDGKADGLPEGYFAAEKKFRDALDELRKLGHYPSKDFFAGHSGFSELDDDLYYTSDEVLRQVDSMLNAMVEATTTSDLEILGEKAGFLADGAKLLAMFAGMAVILPLKGLADKVKGFFSGEGTS